MVAKALLAGQILRIVMFSFNNLFTESSSLTAEPSELIDDPSFAMDV